MSLAAGSAALRDTIDQQNQAARRQRRCVLAWQVGILAVFLGGWELLTRIPWFVAHTIFDPFFISRPSQVVLRIYDWTVGAQAGFLWPHLIATLWGTFLGLFVGVTSGFLVGLALSQNEMLAKVVNPFIVAMNTLPRTTFVPLITMLFGLGTASKVVTAWFIVFFLVFFNAYKGSVSIDPVLIDFCRTLGGSRRQITLAVQIPTTLAWTFASLPNAVSFALIGVVLAEFVGSTTGMGYLLITSLATLNAADMFAAITILSVVGVALVFPLRAVERWLLHWQPEFRERD